MSISGQPNAHYSKFNGEHTEGNLSFQAEDALVSPLEKDKNPSIKHSPFRPCPLFCPLPGEPNSVLPLEKETIPSTEHSPFPPCPLFCLEDLKQPSAHESRNSVGDTNTRPQPVQHDFVPTGDIDDVDAVINNLWNLKKNTDDRTQKLQLALNFWGEQSKAKEKRRDRKKDEIRDLKTEIYQLIGFYSVFQGVLFQAVTQIQSGCDVKGSPITLSVCASVATIIGVNLKFKEIGGLYKALNKDSKDIRLLDARVSRLQLQGPTHFKFTKGQQKVTRGDSQMVVLNDQLQLRKLVEIAVTLALVIFSVIFGYSFKGECLRLGSDSSFVKMVSTKILNRTRRELVIKEGNAGVYATVYTVGVDGELSLTLDLNATYREYVLLIDNNRGVITSDDLIDSKEIEIKFENGRIFWSEKRSRAESSESQSPTKKYRPTSWRKLIPEFLLGRHLGS